MKEMISKELDSERRKLKLTMEQFNDAIGTNYIAFSDTDVKTQDDKISSSAEEKQKLQLSNLKADMKSRYSKKKDELVTYIEKQILDGQMLDNVGSRFTSIELPDAMKKIEETIDSAENSSELGNLFQAGLKIDVKKPQTFIDASKAGLNKGVSMWTVAKNTLGLNDTENDSAFNEYMNSLETEDTAIEGETTVEENTEAEEDEEIKEPTGIQDKLTTLKEDLNANIETIEDKDLVKQIEEISARIDELATVELDAQDLLTKINELKADTETEEGSEEIPAVEGEEGLEDIEDLEDLEV